MSRGVSFAIRFIFFLVLLGGLALGAYAVFNAGQAQGYALGIAQAGAETGELAPGGLPPYAYGYYPHWRPFGFFGGFGLLVLPFFGLLTFLLLARLVFRPWGWRYGYPGRHGMPPHGWHPGWGAPWQPGDKPAESGATPPAEPTDPAR